MSQGGTGGNAYTGAANALTSAGNATQNAIGMFSNVPTAASGMAAYQNPFEKEVIKRSAADIGRMNTMQLDQNRANAARSGAFGGGRQGIVDAATNEASQRAIGDMSANLRSTNFNNAANLANQDIANRFTGASGMLSGAGTLQNLGSTGFNMANTISNQQFEQGMMRQQMEQQRLNDARSMFSNYTNSPINYMNMLNSNAAGSPLSGNSTNMQTTNPGLFNYLSAFFGYKAI